MKRIISFLITVAIIVLLAFTVKDIDITETWTLLKSISPLYFVAAMISYTIFLVIWTIRWRYTMKGFIRGKFFYLTKVLFAGTFLNTITPGTGIGGEPARAYYINKKYHKPKTQVLGYILADKTFNLLSFLIYLILSVLFLNFILNIPLESKLINTLVLVLIAIILGIILLAWKHKDFETEWFAKKLIKTKSLKKKFKNKENLNKYIKKKIRHFFYSIKRVFQKKDKVVMGITLSLVARLFEFSTAYLIFLALGIKINFMIVMAVVTISTLLGDISPTPGGLGVVEGSMIILYSTIGLSTGQATAATVLTRFVEYLITLGLGGLSLLWLRKSE